VRQIDLPPRAIVEITRRVDSAVEISGWSLVSRGWLGNEGIAGRKDPRLDRCRLRVNLVGALRFGIRGAIVASVSDLRPHVVQKAPGGRRRIALELTFLHAPRSISIRTAWERR
jgi:hypothetical protein